MNFSPESASPPSESYVPCLSDTPWMRWLRERPPLPERFPELIASRHKAEAHYRPYRCNKDETAPVSPFRGAAMLGLSLFLKMSGLYERGRRNALDLRLVEEEVTVPGLHEDLEGVRILQISDLHLPRRFPAFADKAAELLNGISVDLCVLTGDYRWGYFGPCDHVPIQLHTILSGVRSRYGVVACMGNHDTVILGQAIEASGIPILFNEGLALPFGAATLWLCGIDDPHNYGCDRIEEAVRDAPPGAFIVLLAHTPERITEAARAGVSLYLSGHTHGGQIRLPLLGALSSNADCAREHQLGIWRYQGMFGHTSAGLGTTDLPVRYNCPPEAVLLTLRRSVPE